MSDPTFHDTPATALELRVLDGPQRGARTPLPAAAGWLLHAGPAEHDDTVQADVALLASQPVQLRVRRQAGHFLLQLVDGAAQLDGQPIAPQREVAWRAGERLQLDGQALAYGPAHLDAWPAPAPAPAMTDGPMPASTTPPPPAPERRWPLVLAGAGAVLVASSAALGLLSQLIPVRAAGAPAARPAPAATPGLDLEAAVADVFRLHGIQARVTRAAGSPSIEVHTTEVDAQRLARAEAAVRRDLPAVQALKVVNRAPARVATRPALEDNPGKRITGVVADEELPYLVTADGSRYFQGAWLPSGHRVVSIADRRVTVELDGVSTELSL